MVACATSASTRGYPHRWLARIVLNVWRRSYNGAKPHSKLGEQPPAEVGITSDYHHEDALVNYNCAILWGSTMASRVRTSILGAAVSTAQAFGLGSAASQAYALAQLELIAECR